MGITVHNSTDLDLIIEDYYIQDAARNVGYYGGLEYSVPARGHMTIPTSVFIQNVLKHLKPQEVHLRSGEETLKVWLGEDFVNNSGKEVFFEMKDEGTVGARFVGRSPITLFQRIWGMLPFHGAGATREREMLRLQILVYQE
ncbi:uncharacterized protein LOC105164950 isoform X2 [Sesamum indicum]|uniref:Uncharacterized protein LOC105164950 isoform X2 n=1 Tax=Sesamum indicum TaxID=4182 RepID=A0A6I9TC37_SESIN|nr:uncharacterized protein LOC105164950 isoform X2 [Sesamum indicum]